MINSRQLSRRQLFQVGAAAGVAATLPSWLVPGAAHADPNVRKAWIPSTENPIIRRGNYDNNTGQTISFVTLMKVHGKGITNQGAGWYLWHWTHPTSDSGAPGGGAVTSDDICRLYGSSTPWRGWTEIGQCNFPDPGGTFDPNHLEAGDIVWNGDHFLCSPHSLDFNTDPPRQNTFLYRSADGQNWTKIGGPILAHGTTDIKHIGYGRFLRDMDGNLARINGKAYWYYNGREFSDGEQGYSRLHLAESSNPSSATAWTKAFNNPLKDLHSGAVFDLGSALLVNSRVWLFSAGRYGSALYYDEARYDNDPYHFNAGPGIPFYSSGALMGGPSYAFDPARHFMVHAALPAPVVPDAGGRFQIDLLTAS
jgi:hypothetical protein